MRNSTYLFSLLLTSLFLWSSCANPEKLSNKGRYDKAIDIAAKRLAGKRKKAKLVLTLERAFAKANARDLDKINYYKKAGQPEYWERINILYRRIMNRQAQIQPLLPLVDDNGRRAIFEFVDVDAQEQESKQKAAAFHFAKAEKSLQAAHNQNNRFAAREAFYEFQKINKYYNNFRDHQNKIREAQALGQTFVWVNTQNKAQVVLPKGFEREMLQLTVRDLDQQWVVFHENRLDDVQYHYNIHVNLTHIEVSPERITESQYTDEKEIPDGEEYILDSRGNVLKDSLGNDVKRPRTKIIRCDILQVAQEKIAHVEGVVALIDNTEQQLLKSEPIAADAIFQNYAARFNGDKRALSKESQQRLGNDVLPFPSDPQLLMQAAETLKPIVKNTIVQQLKFIR